MHNVEPQQQQNKTITLSANIIERIEEILRSDTGMTEEAREYANILHQLKNM